MIIEKPATLYWSPTARRHYQSRRAAIRAEARARIYKRYPLEPFDDETGHWFDIKSEEPVKYARMFNWLIRCITRSHRTNKVAQ